MVDGVTRQYELSSTWDVLQDVINTNVTDPRDIDEWVKNGFPNPASYLKKNGWEFPLVVIMIPEMESTMAVVDATKAFINHNITITCYSNNKETAAKKAEEIKFALEVAAQTDLRKAALHGPDIVGMNIETNFLEGDGTIKFYGVVIEYMFTRFD